MAASGAAPYLATKITGKEGIRSLLFVSILSVLGLTINKGVLGMTNTNGSLMEYACRKNSFKELS